MVTGKAKEALEWDLNIEIWYNGKYQDSLDHGNQVKVNY